MNTLIPIPPPSFINGLTFQNQKHFCREKLELSHLLHKQIRSTVLASALLQIYCGFLECSDLLGVGLLEERRPEFCWIGGVGVEQPAAESGQPVIHQNLHPLAKVPEPEPAACEQDFSRLRTVELEPEPAACEQDFSRLRTECLNRNLPHVNRTLANCERSTRTGTCRM